MTPFFFRIKSGFSLLCVTAFTALLSEALVLQCSYTMRDAWTLPDLYTCIANVSFTGDVRHITEVSQNHMPGRTNNDVTGILIFNQNVPFIPRNISNFFSNIEAFEVVDTGLTEINRDEIFSFADLKQINLSQNQIREIGNGLFEGNPKMTAISLVNNPIRNIAHNVFDHLNQLTNLNVLTTTCINTSADTRVNVESIIFQVSVQCPPTFKMIEERMLKGDDFQSRINEQVAERTSLLSQTIVNVETKLNNHETRIEILEEL